MQTITKECLDRIGIQDDVSLTIKPGSIILPIVASYIVVVGGQPCAKHAARVANWRRAAPTKIN